MSDEPALSVDLALTLGYHHGCGALSPFLNALREGRALGSRCPKCGDVRFPPRRLCLHDRNPTEPLPLDGTGEIIRLTTGSVPVPLSVPAQEQTFAEVLMAGADNRVLARLTGDPAQFRTGAKVRLASPKNPVRHPIQSLVFEPL